MRADWSSCCFGLESGVRMVPVLAVTGSAWPPSWSSAGGELMTPQLMPEVGVNVGGSDMPSGGRLCPVIWHGKLLGSRPMAMLSYHDNKAPSIAGMMQTVMEATRLPSFI